MSMNTRWYGAVILAMLVGSARFASAQSASAEPDTRTQYPPLFQNSYIGLGVGVMNTPLTMSQLRPGFTAASVETPHAALQVLLLGRRFNQFLSAEMSYARPMQWATYKNINGTGENHSVWVVVGSFKLRLHLPITDQLSAYQEVGLALTSRHGAAMDNGTTVVENAGYVTGVVGAGVEYSLNKRWGVTAGFALSGASEANNQPRSVLFTGGVRYHLAPLPADQVAEAARGGYVFPKHLVQVGYAFGGAGFGANHFVSHTVPIFWQGNLAVDHGFTVRYEQNVFHTKKLFAFDLGASVARWHAQHSTEHLASASVYPLLRFFLLRTPTADVHVYYSLSGPSYLSQQTLDGVDIGTNRFTFQDLIGVGIATGQRRQLVFGVGLGHYSNGNLLPINAGVAIPLTFTLGYAY